MLSFGNQEKQQAAEQAAGFGETNTMPNPRQHQRLVGWRNGTTALDAGLSDGWCVPVSELLANRGVTLAAVSSRLD